MSGLTGPGRYRDRWRTLHEAWQVPPLDAPDGEWDALLAWCPPGVQRTEGGVRVGDWLSAAPGDWLVYRATAPGRHPAARWMACTRDEFNRMFWPADA